LKNEYELISRDLNKQIERQNQDIERLKEEKDDAVKNLNSKISTLQESLKFQQEINTKRIFLVYFIMYNKFSETKCGRWKG